jgi:uncharacterized protein (UPF0332 family)
MPIPEQLLQLAKTDFPKGKGKKPHVAFRRIISDLYYSVFHLLTEYGCHFAFGASRKDAFGWRLASRAIEHGEAAKLCIEFVKSDYKATIKKVFHNPVPNDLKQFCGAYVQLQSMRYQADYEMTFNANIVEAQTALSLAEQAHDSWSRLVRNHKNLIRRLILVILFKDKLERL